MSKDFKVKNGLQVTTNITASGNISASGTAHEFGGNIFLDDQKKLVGKNRLNISSSGQLDIFASAIELHPNNDRTINNGSLLLQGPGHITASGNISASGTAHIIGGNVQVDEFSCLGDAVFGRHLSHQGDSDTKITLETNTISITAGNTPHMNFTQNGGTQIATNITASGNISASGTITMLTASIGGGIFTSASLAAGGGGSFSFTGNQFATDLKIGRDADNLIDFTTDNTITFRAEGSNEINLDLNNLRPGGDLGCGLGNSAKQWSHLAVQHITASGNISSSAKLFVHQTISGDADIIAGGKLKVGSSGLRLQELNGGINVQDGAFSAQHITASGNISASGDLSVNGINIAGNITHIGDSNTSINFGDDDIRITAGGIVTQFTTTTIGFGGKSLFDVGNITASGNISASGTLSGDDLVLRDDTQATNTPSVQLRNDTNHPGAQQSILFSSGSPITSAGNDTARLNFIPQATVGSFNLDNFIATGTIGLRTNNVTRLEASATGIDVTGNITASGDISASGTIKAEHLHSTDDIEIGDSIIHSGDTNTKIGFSTDKITFTAGGVSLLTLQEASNDVAIFSNNISASNTSGVHVFGGSTTFTGNTSFGGFINNAGAGVAASHINVNTSELTASFHQGGNLASGIGSFIINYGDAATFSGSLSNAGNGYGEIVSHFVINSAVSAGDVVYYNGSDFRHTDADASSSSTSLLGVAMVDGAGTAGPVLLRGIVRLGAGHIVDTSGDAGDVLYVSTTLAHVQFAAPSGASDIARIVGYCMNEANDVIYFNPSSTFVEVG